MSSGAGVPGHSSRRVFIGVPLSDAARDAVTRLVASVRAGPPSVAGREVRWVRLEGLHVTLRFLGPTPVSRLDDVVAAMDAVARSRSPFEADLAGGGAFPDVRRPRTLWLGIGRGATQLAELATRLDDELSVRGWPRDDRPFRSHLTLARSDGVAAGRETAQRLITAASDLVVSSPVDRLTMYESVTGGGPAHYVVLEQALLADATSTG